MNLISDENSEKPKPIIQKLVFLDTILVLLLPGYKQPDYVPGYNS